MFNINDFLGIAIVGVALSFVIEMIQAKYKVGSRATKGLTIALSILVGAGYYFIQSTAWYEPMLGILAAASTTYALLFKGASKSVNSEDLG